jgi:hypothetical protein
MSWALTVRPKSELKRMLHVATTQETLANTSAIGKISCRPRSQADMWSFQGRALLPSIVVSAEIRSKRLLMRDRCDPQLKASARHHATKHHNTTQHNTPPISSPGYIQCFSSTILLPSSQFIPLFKTDPSIPPDLAWSRDPARSVSRNLWSNSGGRRDRGRPSILLWILRRKAAGEVDPCRPFQGQS